MRRRCERSRRRARSNGPRPSGCCAWTGDRRQAIRDLIPSATVLPRMRHPVIASSSAHPPRLPPSIACQIFFAQSSLYFCGSFQSHGVFVFVTSSMSYTFLTNAVLRLRSSPRLLRFPIHWRADCGTGLSWLTTSSPSSTSRSTMARKQSHLSSTSHLTCRGEAEQSL
jgi:hypothetical protein